MQDPLSENLCAFCAHRLGQARKPSHTQRRFLQSSRPVSKPPAEATARRENDTTNVQPAWGQTAPQTQNSVGSTSASWTSPMFGKGGLDNSKAGGSWGRPAFGSKGNAASQLTSASRGGRSVGDEELLPHERRAREQLLEKQPAVSQVEPPAVSEKNSSTKTAPFQMRRTQVDRLELARMAHERKKGRERDSMNSANSNGTTRHSSRPGTSRLVIRHSLGDVVTPSAANRDEPLPKWSQLRTKEQRHSQEVAVPAQDNPRKDGLDASIGHKEEISKNAKYTPLVVDRPKSSRSIFRYTYDQGAQIDKSEERSIRLGASDSNTSSERSIRLGASDSNTSSEHAKVDKFGSKDEVDNLAEQEENEVSARPAREKKKKARGRTEPDAYQSYDDIPRGKGRDKAKRRQKFNLGEDIEEDQNVALARAELKRLRKAEKAAKKMAPVPMLLPEYISVSNLAVALKVRLEDFVRKMEQLGFEETNHDYILNAENAGLIAMEYNFEPIIDRGESEDLRARAPVQDPSSLPSRPPVVTIMGHVDHGKTTLLDWLRKSSVAATEHGGITQHIGAFSVPMPGGKLITFLDTPGHAAFLSMRQRGANVTDIVILVVAADDSVKPQTIEAINHAKTAKVPIIVAINKIDKEDSNVDRVKQDLARHGVDVEDYGGDTQVVCVSGKTGQGMDELEEAAVTLSEILDMRAETDGQAEGWVLEASIKSMGKVATVLVRRGTMRPGDFIVAGQTWARIRCLRNEAGVEIEEAGPGTPVEIDGWREQPLAGDEVLQASDESKAKSVIEYRRENHERDKMAEDMEAINEFRRGEQEKKERDKAEAAAAKVAALSGTDAEAAVPTTKAGGPKQIYFIVKGDVSGSVEAVIESISALGNQEVQPNILRSGVGQISEFDIEHAATARGLVINFNTTVEPHISRLAEENRVSIIDQNIIYRLVDDVKAELSKHLPPLITQRVVGEAEIAQVFDITIKGRKQKPIAGCKVRNGTVSKNERVRVMRGSEKIFDGMLSKFPSLLATY